MIVNQSITWQAVNWPGTTPAADYLVYNGTAPTTAVASATGGNTSATITYDDTLAGVIFLVRPVDNVSSPTAWGPVQSIVLGQMNNRGWIRSYIRKSISDRADTTNTPTITDDEINGYINDAIRDYSMKFPTETDTTITLNSGDPVNDRIYVLPADVYIITQCKYHRVDGHLDMYLTPMEWKGGETGSTNWVGYAKFGVWQSPLGGRYFPGHYSTWEGKLYIDFDPRGDGDSLVIRYKKLLTLPTDDVTDIGTPPDATELITLYAAAKTWLELEAKDARLSRWRTKEDGGRRDDLPTEKMSSRLFNAYNAKLNERRTLRVKDYRLVRRA